QVYARAQRARLETDGFPNRRRGVVVPALGQQDHSQAVVNHRIAGRHGDGVLVRRDGLVESSLSGERDGEVVARLGVRRREPNRLPDRLLFLDPLALPPAARGAAYQSQRAIALPPDRLAKRRLGEAPLALPLERDAELEVRLHASRLEDNRGAQLRLRLGILSLAERQIAAMESFAVIFHRRHVTP